MLHNVNGPRWDSGLCQISTQLRRNGKDKLSPLTLNCRAFDTTPGTFLYEAIANQSFPMHKSVADKFRRALLELSEDADAIRILSSRPEMLNASDMVRLFKRLEMAVSTWGTEQSRKTMFSQAMKPLREMPLTLGDGSAASETGFKTRFKAPVSNKEHAADRPLLKPAETSPQSSADTTDFPPPELDSLEFHTLQERNAKAFDGSRKRREFLAELCMQTFARHEALVARLNEERARGLPDLGPRSVGLAKGGYVDPTVFSRLPEDERLRVVLHIFERDNRHLSTPAYAAHMPLHGFSALEDSVPPGWRLTAQARIELLLSCHYLPAHVVAACFVAIQNEKGGNAEVLSSLAATDVAKTSRGYKFVGLKAKTDQIQAREVEEDASKSAPFTGAAAVKAFDLLLSNARQLQKLTGEEVPLFSTISQQFIRGEPVRLAEKGPLKLLEIFCNINNLEKFNTRYLRDLSLQTHLLSPEGNLYSAQALAGHADPNTTKKYSNTRVEQFLHAANIRRFMDMLAGSILWRTGRTGLLEQTGLAKRGFNLQLLFPLEAHDDTEASAIEEWVKSNYTTELSLGLDELEQCAAQYWFYQQHLPLLPQQNPTRFVVVHVPRVLSCYAMREIILASPYASVYRKFEKAMQ